MSDGHSHLGGRAKDPGIVHAMQKPFEHATSAFGTAVVVLLVVILALSAKDCAHKREQARAERAAARAAARRAVAVYTPTIQRVGCVSRLLEFKNFQSGEIVTYITGHDFRIYPKGGSVHAFPPDGKNYVDTPGVDVKTHHGPGEWRWRREDPKATGVEICE